MRHRILSLVVLTTVGALVGLCAGWVASGRIEQSLEVRANRTLSAMGAGWAKAKSDGLIIAFTGVAPNVDAPLVVERRLAQLSDWIFVVNQSSPAILVSMVAPLPKIEIMRGLNQIILSGRQPSKMGAISIAKALGASSDHLAITDLTVSVGTTAQPENWFEAQRSAVIVAGKMLHGRVTVGGETFVAVGLAQDVTALAVIDAEASHLAGLGWVVKSEVTAPQAIRDVFVMQASIGGDAPGLYKCTAENAADAELVEKRAAEIFGQSAEKCRIGGTTPHPAWVETAINALAVVAELPRADLILRDMQIELIGAPPTRKRAIQAAMEKLDDLAPDGFEIVLQGGVGSGWEAPSPRGVSEGEVLQLRFAAELSTDGDIILSGVAPEAADLGRTQAMVAFPGAAISGGADLFSAAPPTGWRRAVGAGLAGLAQLEDGRVDVVEGSVQLQGRVTSQGYIRAVHDALAASLPQDWRLASRLTVAPQALADEQPRPIAQCAAQMAEIVIDAPIMFAPASSEIDPVSRHVLSKLARAVRGCAGGRVEIAGHTDSQGREAANLGLSRTRADAVLDALLLEGASIRSLVAHGYGEAMPVASNANEAGRALNRRIEFSVWSDDQ